MRVSARARWDALWAGEVDPLVYAILRVGVATLVLLRVSDWTAPFLQLDHHAWVSGLDHAPGADPAETPWLEMPLVPGLPSPHGLVAAALAWARLPLAGLVLLGIRARPAALLLAIAGYGLMALDAARYFHHLHLLWLSCALVALTPCDARLAVIRRGGPSAPRWPLTLWRLQALVIYGAAGLAKLDPRWLDGTSLRLIAERFPFEGVFWDAGLGLVGHAGMATAIALWELALVPLLAWRKTRLLGVALGLALHVVLDTTTMVSTFGASMALFLVTFLPWERRLFRTSSRSADPAAT